MVFIRKGKTDKIIVLIDAFNVVSFTDNHLSVITPELDVVDVSGMEISIPDSLTK